MKPDEKELDLTEDEIETLKQSERCEGCGHLKALHNYHCCEFCQVIGCKCEWGELPKE